MALVPCAQCRQPFYASCHDGSCCDVLCPYCEYAEMPLPLIHSAGDAPALAVTHEATPQAQARHNQHDEPTLTQRWRGESGAGCRAGDR